MRIPGGNGDFQMVVFTIGSFSIPLQNCWVDLYLFWISENYCFSKVEMLNYSSSVKGRNQVKDLLLKL